MTYAYIALLLAAFILIHFLAGGTRLIHAIPAYELLAAAGVLTVFSLRRSRESPRFWCVLSMFVFTAYVVVRCLFSEIPFLARNDLFLVLACALVYLLTAYFITDTQQRCVVLAGLFALASVHVIVGLVQFGRGEDFMLFGLGRSPSGRRASGLFVNPNHFAGFLEVISVLGLSLVWWSRLSLRQKILAGYVTISCLGGVALSGSRGGYLSAAIGLAAFGAATLWTVRKTDPQRYPIATIYIGVGIAVFAFATSLTQKNPMLSDRISRIGDEDIRIYNWEAAIDQFEASPIFGTGAGTHAYYGRFFRRPQVQVDPVHAHNDYLELLAEYGIAGTLAMLLFLAAHVTSAIRNAVFIARERLEKFYVPRSNGFALQIGALAGVAAMGFHSFIDFNLHIPANALLFAFLFGVMANPGAEVTHSPVLGGTGAFRFALPVLSAALALTAGLRLPGLYFEEQTRRALRDRRFSDTVAVARRGIPHDPRNPNFFFYMGEAHRALASTRRLRAASGTPNFTAAIESYRQGLLIYPQDETMLVRMAQALDGIRKFDEAEAFYRRAIEVDPNFGMTHIYFSEHLKAMGRNAEAAAEFELGREYLTKDISRFRLPEFRNRE